MPKPKEFEGCHSGGMSIGGVSVSVWREDGDVKTIIPPEELARWRKEYGADNWYDWCNEHWGTKWDAGEEVELDVDEPDLLEYTFDTAWNAPEGICEALREKFPELGIVWFYDEPGNQIAGYL